MDTYSIPTRLGAGVGVCTWQNTFFTMTHKKLLTSGNSLVVQWLRLHGTLPLPGPWVHSLVGELRSCKLHAEGKKKKEKRKVAYNLLSHLPCLENLSPSFMEAAQVGGFASTAWLSLIPFPVVQTPVKSLCVVSICSAFLPLDIKLPKDGQFCPHLRSDTMLVTSPQWKEAELITFSESKSESHTVTSDSLRPHWLYSPWNSPRQNTGVGSLSLLQETFPTQGSNPGVPHCRRILYQLSHKGRPKFPEGHANSLGSSSERINLFIIYTFINYLPAFYYWARFMKIVVKKKNN